MEYLNCQEINITNDLMEKNRKTPAFTNTPFSFGEI